MTNGSLEIKTSKNKIRMLSKFMTNVRQFKSISFFYQIYFQIYDLLQKYGWIDLREILLCLILKQISNIAVVVSLRLLLDVDILLDLLNGLQVVVEVDHRLVVVDPLLNIVQLELPLLLPLSLKSV